MSSVRPIHVTNGDSTAERIRQAGIPGPIVIWRDVLHAGPVPRAASAEELRQLRAEYLAAIGIGDRDAILAQLEARDSTLSQAPTYGQIILWFEHDLCDQLQLIQILDWFAEHGGTDLPIYLICIGSYPGIARFTGLGQLTPAQLRPLLDRRRKVKSDEFAAARTAWAAYTSSDPKQLEAYVHGDSGVLPFLRPALIRHLEDFPLLHSGVSRTEKQLIEVVRDGMHTPFEVFIASQERELAPFHGDAIVWSILVSLSSGKAPLLTCNSEAFALPANGKPNDAFLRQSVTLTDLGRQVVAARADWISYRGIDRWLGGVHLVGDTTPWRWDERRGRLIAS